MGIVFKNNAKTTLASSLSNSATSATVTDGSVFPSLSAGEFFLITFDDGSNNEICKCTARSGNTLTIVRAQESTTARAFSSGDAAEGRVTAGVLETIQENIAAKSANQTVFNATTAGGATTYNIGTNPGVEANAMVFLNGVLQHHDTISFSGTNLTFDAAPPNGMALEVIIDNLINLQSSNLTVDTFTAADVSGNPQTDFTLSDTPAAETNLIVFVDGVFQDQDAYTISSNTLTITTGVIAGRGVTVYVINPVNIGTPSDSTVTSDKLSGNITMPGSLTVGSHDVAFDSPTFFVDHTNSRVGLGTASPSVPVDIVGEVKTSSHINIGGNLVKASGDLTLDVAGDIILDADGGDITFKDGGTSVGAFDLTGGFAIKSNASDADFFIQGNDGGSAINAVQFDMSEAGKALFNAGASFGSDVSIVSTGDGLSLSRSGYDTFSLQHSTGNGMAIRNITDSRTEMFFDGAGNVGIGETSPDRILHVKKSDAAGTVAKFENSAGTVFIELNTNNQAGGDAGYIAYNSDKDMSFLTDDTERVRINANGKVSIGGTEDTYDLMIKRASSASATSLVLQRIWNENQGWTAEALTEYYTDLDNSSYPRAQVGFYRGDTGDNNSSGFIVKTGLSSSGMATRFKVTATGMVEMPEQPAFMAKLTSSQTITDSFATVAFNSESFDRKNNHSNGVFTAPHAGVYLFGANFLVYPWTSGIFNFAFYKDGNNYSGTIQAGAQANSHSNVSHQCLIECNANDEITVRVAGSSMNTGASVYGSQAYWWGYMVG